ncbi:MAG: hypothetical protein JW384_01406 [Nitrosomonadaceae bacterium]|nr:hypothetical protein [Nitrosomonadaceae bacterium]
MPRSVPFRQLGDYTPAIAQGQGAVTWADMGAQIVEQTFVAGTTGGNNIVGHSFKTSNVLWAFYATRGESYRYHVYEVTTPETSCLVFGITIAGNSGNRLEGVAGAGDNARAGNLFGRLIITQRQ